MWWFVYALAVISTPQLVACNQTDDVYDDTYLRCGNGEYVDAASATCANCPTGTYKTLVGDEPDARTACDLCDACIDVYNSSGAVVVDVSSFITANFSVKSRYESWSKR